MTTKAQQTQPPVDHQPSEPIALAPHTGPRCLDLCQSRNGGACTCDMAARLEYELWSLDQQFDMARRTVSAYRDIARAGGLGQAQIDTLHARWWNYCSEQQKEAREAVQLLQSRLEEQMAQNQAARATLELQNREILRARALHSQMDALEREMAESRSGNQAAEKVLAMEKQRIAELEAALAGHESLKLQFSALEAEHTEAVEMLIELEKGSVSGELIGQNKALRQQLRELRDENKSLAEQLATREKGGDKLHGMRPVEVKEPEARNTTDGAGDEGKGKKRRRAK